jgi:alkylhydroperoxidase family enzyme
LREHFSEEAMLELLMLAGVYRMVSYLTNALRLPLESFGVRFPDERMGAS